ncbi:hypothetical protein PROFUN_15990 [Planoprotostelium fungivorum]|uniref:Uncharacterized protein n=1 Tax=Planoprotostelium fungivorum TaxID=1890364 RepID=A0A2P6MTE0_9EUKA|nr:hypothetical protein PROFUN_15990 [Planoprotostelium fungivorum]
MQFSVSLRQTEGTPTALSSACAYGEKVLPSACTAHKAKCMRVECSEEQLKCPQNKLLISILLSK